MSRNHFIKNFKYLNINAESFLYPIIGFSEIAWFFISVNPLWHDRCMINVYFLLCWFHLERGERITDPNKIKTIVKFESLKFIIYNAKIIIYKTKIASNNLEIKFWMNIIKITSENRICSKSSLISI